MTESTARLRVRPRKGRLTDGPCTLCNSWQPKTGAAAGIYVEGIEPEVELGPVCPDCYRAGPSGAAARADIALNVMAEMIVSKGAIAHRLKTAQVTPEGWDLGPATSPADLFNEGKPPVPPGTLLA